MLKEHGVEHSYREYTQAPLSVEELRELLRKLELPARKILRSRDAKALGLDAASMDDDAIIAAMAEHPSLIERPIGVKGERAVVGRPPERLLEL